MLNWTTTSGGADDPPSDAQPASGPTSKAIAILIPLLLRSTARDYRPGRPPRPAPLRGRSPDGSAAPAGAAATAPPATRQVAWVHAAANRSSWLTRTIAPG